MVWCIGQHVLCPDTLCCSVKLSSYTTHYSLNMCTLTHTHTHTHTHCTPYTPGLTVTAQFNRHRVKGSVAFTQTDSNAMVDISVNLTNLGMAEIMNIPWAIHTLPLPPSAPDPCLSVVGAVYRNLPELSELKHSYSSDGIALFGPESIVGRSLVINIIHSQNLSICATINPPNTVNVLWAPFRNYDITNGNVFLWQQTMYFNLTTDRSSSSLTWTTSTDTVGGACTGDSGTVCEWSGSVNVSDDVRVQQVVTVPGLDAAENYSLTVGGEGSTSSTPLRPYHPLVVVAEVEGEGGLELRQRTPLDWTEVIVTGGLADRNYSIHTLPPDKGCTGTRGVYNPRNVNSSMGGETFDLYPFGDLSRKFENEAIYFDPYLPLSGSESVVGRSLVVMNGGSIEGCGLLRYAGEAIQMQATLPMDGFSGTITFSQPANNPLADTIITIDISISAVVELFSSTPSSATPSPSLTLPPLTPSPSFSSVTHTPLTISLDSPQPLSETPSPSLLMPFTTSLPLLMPSTTDFFFFMPSSTPIMTGAPTTSERRRRRREAAESDALFKWSLRMFDSLSGDCGLIIGG